MTHYFSKATLTPIGARGRILKLSFDAYDIHREVWNLFPNNPETNRNFIYSRLDGDRTLYVVSDCEPTCNDSWFVQTKAYDPIIHEGDVFGFRLCANPTISNDSTGKHQRHDVVMNLKKKYREEGLNVSMNDIIVESVTNWIVRKASINGFEVEQQGLMIHSYSRNEASKSKKSKIVFSTVMIEGALRVTDAELFKKALFSGIGASKSFGCGLLMIRRI